jgi:hypothetical protein
VTEAYAVAYDAVSKRLVVSSQDTGTAYQREERGGTLYNAIGGGDGHNAAAVNDKTRSDQSALYTSSQWLSSLTRWTVDPRGQCRRRHVLHDDRRMPAYDEPDGADRRLRTRGLHGALQHPGGRLPAQRQQVRAEQGGPHHDRAGHELRLHHDRRQCG